MARVDLPYEIGLVLQFDRYEAVNGNAIRGVGETDAELAERQGSYEEIGLIDYYFFGQPLRGLTADRDLVFLNLLRRFDSADDASRWLEEAIGGLSDRGSTDVEPVDDPPDLAIETVAVSYVNPDGLTTWRIDVRDGAIVSTMLLRGSTPASWEILETIATARADCLAEDACLDPVPVEDEFTAARA